MRLWAGSVVFLLVVFAAGSAAVGQTVVPGPEGPTEADLEAEFSRKRDTLRASPEYQGRGKDAGSHFRLGQTLAHRGDLTGATEEYRTAIQLSPDFAEAYRGLGVVLLDRRDWAGAADALRTAVRLEVKDSDTYYWLGRALMGRQEWAEAEAALRTAAKLKPNEAEAYADLGLVYMIQGKVKPATEVLQQSVSLKPDYAEAHSLLEILMAHSGDPAQVIGEARGNWTILFGR